MDPKENENGAGLVSLDSGMVVVLDSVLVDNLKGFLEKSTEIDSTCG